MREGRGVCVGVGVLKGEREDAQRERGGGEGDRQTDRDKERKRQAARDRQRDTQTDRDRKTEKLNNRENTTDRHTEIDRNRPIDLASQTCQGHTNTERLVVEVVDRGGGGREWRGGQTLVGRERSQREELAHPLREHKKDGAQRGMPR